MTGSIRSILSYAGQLVSHALPEAPQTRSDVNHYEPLSGAPSCPIDGPISCHNNTPIAGDSCCFVYPGGKILLTQFWDEEEHVGGADTDWTLHGLWPDNCDGGYDQFCHMTPTYKNVTEVLQQYEQQELLDFMNRYWIADHGPNSNLWEHEYNKHATCINTLAPSCYGDDFKSGMEVVDYFTRATALFRTLDTYHALESAGIVPDSQKVYALTDIQNAVERYSGGRAVLRCTDRGDVLHEAWYVYYVQGSLQSGQFVPAQELGKERDAGNCRPSVKYLPKKSKGTWTSGDM